MAVCEYLGVGYSEEGREDERQEIGEKRKRKGEGMLEWKTWCVCVCVCDTGEPQISFLKCYPCPSLPLSTRSLICMKLTKQSRLVC